MESIHAKRLHPRLSVFLYFTYHKAISQGDFKKDAPLARGLTGLRPEGCGRLSAAGCVSLRSGGDSACGAEGCGIAPWAMSFISRLRRSRQHRVSILSAYLVHPFPLRGTSPQGETRALRDWLSVSYGMISILRIGSLRSPPPIRLRRTAPCSGGRIKL